MAKWVFPEGRKPLTDKDLADLNRRLADTVIKLNRRCAELEAALADVAEGEPEWPYDPTKELQWCRKRAASALALLRKGDG